MPGNGTWDSSGNVRIGTYKNGKFIINPGEWFTDGLGVYVSNNQSAIYAEQNGIGNAGTFSGKVNITSVLTLNGDLVTTSNKHGAVSTPTSNLPWSGVATCHRAYDNHTGCRCPDGYYMIGLRFTENDRNDFSIQCAQL
jgi:hypothetical protein